MNIHEWMGESIPNDVLQQTATWIAMLDALDANVEFLESNLDKLDEDKQARFFNWLGEDTRHQHAFAEMSEMWAKTACLHSLHSMLESAQIIPFPSKIPATEISQSEQFLLSDPLTCGETYSPSWLYSLTLIIIAIGMLAPALTFL